MTLPIADAGSGGAVIPYSEWVVGGGASRALVGGTHTPVRGTIVGWQWTVLDEPDGSEAALEDGETNTPTLTAIDSGGDYRLFLVVTNSFGDISETNPFLAPQSAFVTVSATSQYSGLKKQAIGERNYINHSRTLVDEVDSLRGEAWYELNAGAPSSLSNKTAATAFAGMSANQALVTNHGFKFRAEFVNVVAVGDNADLSLYISPTTNFADGVQVTSITIDATCSALLSGYLRISEAGVTVSVDAQNKKKGSGVPAELVPDLDCAIAYAHTNAYFIWVLTPAGSGTWTASSTATIFAQLWRNIGKFN